MRGPSIVFDAVDVPCSGPLHFADIADYVYDGCPLSDRYVVILSLYAMMSKLVSILVCAFES